jgi:hypothetical protein
MAIGCAGLIPFLAPRSSHGNDGQCSADAQTKSETSDAQADGGALKKITPKDFLRDDQPSPLYSLFIHITRKIS